MGFTTIDYIIVLVYLVGVAVFGDGFLKHFPLYIIEGIGYFIYLSHQTEIPFFSLALVVELGRCHCA